MNKQKISSVSFIIFYLQKIAKIKIRLESYISMSHSFEPKTHLE